jgi:hypothetical protein
MSTNISELMFEMEGYGIPKNRVAEIVAALVQAGRRTVAASLGELAGEPEATDGELQAIAATLVARSHSRSDVVAAVSSNPRTTGA